MHEISRPSVQFSVQSFSHVWLFVTPWTAACQVSLSTTKSRSLLKLVSIESVMPSNHLILCRPPLLPSGSFPKSQFFTSGGLSIGVSVSPSILPVNIQDWFPLVLTGWISLQSKRLSGEGGKTEIRRWGDGATNRGMRATSIHWNRPEDRFSPRASRETVLPTPWF